MRWYMRRGRADALLVIALAAALLLPLSCSDEPEIDLSDLDDDAPSVTKSGDRPGTRAQEPDRPNQGPALRGDAPAPAGWDAARLLPDDTIAYLRLSNLSKVVDEVAKGNTAKQLLEILEKEAEPAAVEMVRAVLATAGRVRALHVSFHGAVEYRRQVDVDLLAIADVGQATPLPDFLPHSLMRFLAKTDKVNGVQIYELTEDLRREAEIRLYVASVDGKVLISTDRSVFEGVLSTLEREREDSLADNRLFKKLRRGQAGADVALYVSVPQLIGLIEPTLSRYERRDFRAVSKALGLRDVKYASCALDYAGRGISVKLLSDPYGQPYQLLAQPPASKAVFAYLPQGTRIAIAASVGDGKATWARLRRHISDCLLAVEGRHDEAEFRRELAEAQRKVGVNFADAAALIDELGFFLDAEGQDGGQREPPFGLFIKVKGAQMAARLMGQLVRTAFRDQVKTQQHRGTAIHTAQRDFHWSIVGDYVFISPRPEIIKRVIDAKAAQNGLDRSERFTRLTPLLAEKNVVFAYVDTAGFLPEIERELNDLPAPVVQLLRGLSHGAVLTADDGLIEVQVAQSRPVGVVRILDTVLLSALGAAQKQAMRTQSLSNLHQIALALRMYVAKHATYPTSLKALLDEKFVVAKLFIHPSRRGAAVGPGFVSDYDSTLDRAKFRIGAGAPPGRLMLAWEKRRFFPRGRCVLCFDGSARFVSQWQFDRLLVQVDKWIAAHRPKP